MAAAYPKNLATLHKAFGKPCEDMWVAGIFAAGDLLTLRTTPQRKRKMNLDILKLPYAKLHATAKKDVDRFKMKINQLQAQKSENPYQFTCSDDCTLEFAKRTLKNIERNNYLQKLEKNAQAYHEAKDSFHSARLRTVDDGLQEFMQALDRLEQDIMNRHGKYLIPMNSSTSGVETARHVNPMIVKGVANVTYSSLFFKRAKKAFSEPERKTFFTLATKKFPSDWHYVAKLQKECDTLAQYLEDAKQRPDNSSRTLLSPL